MLHQPSQGFNAKYTAPVLHEIANCVMYRIIIEQN